MSNFRKTLIRWYRSDSFLKRSISCLISYFFFLAFSFVKDITHAKQLARDMKRRGIFQSSLFAFIDMIFCDLFFGYNPAKYATLSFNKLSLRQRLTFMPPYEYGLFAKSLNMEGDVEMLADKNRTYHFLKDFYGREQIVIKTKENRSTFIDFLNRHKSFFYKPLDGTCGKNSGKACAQDIDVNSFFDNLISIGAFVIEELIVQCKEIAVFHPSSVNTVRVVIFKSKKGSELLYGCLRCGQGGNVIDNGGSGGIFIPFNPENGRLNKIGFDECGNKFIVHPDTQKPFEGFQIPRFDEIKALTIKATEKLPGLRYIGWDVAVSEDKVMLVEGNHWPTILVLEGLHSIGFKKELREIAKTELIPESFRNKQNTINQY